MQFWSQEHMYEGYDIYEWIYAQFSLNEYVATVVQIDGPKRIY